jgi:hypothetical protein
VDLHSLRVHCRLTAEHDVTVLRFDASARYLMVGTRYGVAWWEVESCRPAKEVSMTATPSEDGVSGFSADSTYAYSYREWAGGSPKISIWKYE